MAKKDKVIKTAEKYVKQGKLINAIAEYKKLLETNPNDWGTINLIGDLCVRIGENQQAIEYFNRLGEHYAKDGFYLKAIAICKKITKLDPNNMPAYAKLGHLYAKQGLPLEARANYQIVADHYINHKEYIKAAEIYQSLAELDPENLIVRQKLAEINFRLGKPEDSIQELFTIAKEQIRKEKYDESRKLLRKVLEMQPDHSGAIFNLADIYCKSGDPEKAIKLFTQYLEKDPDNVELNSRLGELYLNMGDFSKAEEIFKKIAQLAPEDRIAKMHLGLVSLEQGDIENAYNMMEPFIDEAIKNKDEDQAIIYLNQILQKNNRHAPTLEKLAKIYINLSQVKPLISTLNTLSDVYIETENYRKAHTVLEKLVDLDSENTEFLKKFNWLRSQITLTEEEKEVASILAEEPAEAQEIIAEEEAIEEIKPLEEPEEIEVQIEEEISQEEAIAQEWQALSAAEEQIEEPPPIEIKPEEAPTLDIIGAKEMKDERLKVLENALIEAEIFSKYGLVDKAQEKLLSLLPEFDLNPQVHKVLKEIYIEQKHYEEAAKEYIKLINIYEEQEENELALQSHREALEVLPQGMIEEDYSKLVQAFAEKSMADIEVFEEEVERVPYIEEKIEEIQPAKTVGEKPEEAFEIITPEPSEQEEEVVEKISPIEFAEPVQLEPEPLEPQIEEEAGIEEIPEAKGKVGTLDEAILEALEEVDFYIDQGFPREAQSLVVNLYQKFPHHEGVLIRLERLNIDPEAIERGEIIAVPIDEISPGEVQEAPMEEIIEPSEIDSELSEAFSRYEQQEALGEEKRSLDEPLDLREDKFVTDEELFAEEESFFNLSSELGEDFLQSMTPEETTESVPVIEKFGEEKDELKELLKDLKADIRQKVEEEDYETRYNLGIAYKEMSLIDEAIAEFQISVKSTDRYVDSCTMLGLCFLEKGMNEQALQWFHKAIEKVEKEEEKIGVLYYMAQAYQQMDKLGKALDIYNFIYKEDANFQDVAERIKSLTTKN
jgi:tetratricopeptide (TPR) repeat protein